MKSSKRLSSSRRQKQGTQGTSGPIPARKRNGSQKNGSLVVELVGPAGVGKTTLALLLDEGPVFGMKGSNVTRLRATLGRHRNGH